MSFFYALYAGLLFSVFTWTVAVDTIGEVIFGFDMGVTESVDAVVGTETVIDRAEPMAFLSIAVYLASVGAPFWVIVLLAD